MKIRSACFILFRRFACACSCVVFVFVFWYLTVNLDWVLIALHSYMFRSHTCTHTRAGSRQFHWKSYTMQQMNRCFCNRFGVFISNMNDKWTFRFMPFCSDNCYHILNSDAMPLCVLPLNASLYQFYCLFTTKNTHSINLIVSVHIAIFFVSSIPVCLLVGLTYNVVWAFNWLYQLTSG